uniref:Membrane magnesium transporter n=1 Tax=Phaeomonas parva TaxID=124430 RepID=A0A7S1XSD2_9STRA|mmetsp:Transcript_28941/g.92525  ORF Transcript_28941/g.92525 Transcript_28941/m.92525 type:complete len:162 (+) Transcript_28941:40-525(+)
MPSTLNPNLKVVLLLVLHATMAASSALSVGFMLANPALLRYNDRNMDFADAAALTHAALALGFCATAVLLARHLPPRLLRAGGVDLQLANPTVRARTPTLTPMPIQPQPHPSRRRSPSRATAAPSAAAAAPPTTRACAPRRCEKLSLSAQPLPLRERCHGA